MRNRRQRQCNTAVLIDREGKVAGYYRELFVYWGEGLHCSRERVNRLLKEHTGEVEQERFFEMESWYLLRSTKPGLRIRDLCREYDIETLREYRHRSRRHINHAREEGQRI